MDHISELCQNNLSGQKTDRKTEVAKIIKQAILLGNLKPGERLVEADLATKMGVSRGPLREAIRELVSEGLLINIPRRGTYIATFTTDEVKEIYSIRILLEGMATKLAVQNFTDQDLDELQHYFDCMVKAADEKDVTALLENDFRFHQLIYLKSQNKYLIKFLTEISTVYRLSLNEGIKWIKDLNHLAMMHKPILEVFKEKSTEKAESVIKDHLSWL